MKLNKLFIIICAVAVIGCGLFMIVYNRFYFDEYRYKRYCVNRIVDELENNKDLQYEFTQLNQKLSDISNEYNSEIVKVLAPDVISAKNQISHDEMVSGLYHQIQDQYKFINNSIYMIIFDDSDIYYVFEESEYIILFSDSCDPNVNAINNEDSYKKYVLSNNIYLFEKI